MKVFKERYLRCYSLKIDNLFFGQDNIFFIFVLLLFVLSFFLSFFFLSFFHAEKKPEERPGIRFTQDVITQLKRVKTGAFLHRIQRVPN